MSTTEQIILLMRNQRLVNDVSSDDLLEMYANYVKLSALEEDTFYSNTYQTYVNFLENHILERMTTYFE